MLIKTRSSGMVWVEWPPVEAAEVWCRGPAPDGGDGSPVYRLVDGAWVPGEWEDAGPPVRQRELLH